MLYRRKIITYIKIWVLFIKNFLSFNKVRNY
nr:MAG TPA: hypothetical protein [Caudoviricetes sp.]